MKWMDLLTQSSCIIVSMAYPLVMSAEGKISKNPNIILILADDLGYGDISALNSSSKLHTENIDKIANSGVIFTDAHASASVSTPSRYSLLTGRYNWRSSLPSGVLNGFSKALIPKERRTLANILKDRGYRTGCIGKWHLGWNWNNIDAGTENVDYKRPITNGPISRGFDYFYGIAASLDMPPYVYVKNNTVTSLPDRVTQGTSMENFGFWRKGVTSKDFNHEKVLPNLIEHAISYIHKQAIQKSPFFLYLPLPSPHTPILPSKEFQGKSHLNPYGDFVLMVDDMVGKILNAIKSNGIENNTIVIFCSDNGCSPVAHIPDLQSKGHYPSYIYRGHKADLFEGGHRLPCFISWPGKISPHTVDQIICFTDFYRTLGALTGYYLKDDEGEDSYDLTPLLFNKKGTVIRTSIVSQSIEGDIAIRNKNWKLLLTPTSGGWSFPDPDIDTSKLKTFSPIQLYNLDKDPEEKINVYQKHSRKINQLKNDLERIILKGRSTPGKEQKNENPNLIKFITHIKFQIL